MTPSTNLFETVDMGRSCSCC